VVARVIVDPGIAVSVVFEIVRVAWFPNAKIKVFVEEVAELYPVLAALIAVTTHVAAVEAVKLLSLIVHPEPLAE
jgi:hypothetical protein